MKASLHYSEKPMLERFKPFVGEYCETAALKLVQDYAVRYFVSLPLILHTRVVQRLTRYLWTYN